MIAERRELDSNGAPSIALAVDAPIQRAQAIGRLLALLLEDLTPGGSGNGDAYAPIGCATTWSALNTRAPCRAARGHRVRRRARRGSLSLKSYPTPIVLSSTGPSAYPRGAIATAQGAPFSDARVWSPSTVRPTRAVARRADDEEVGRLLAAGACAGHGRPTRRALSRSGG